MNFRRLILAAATAAVAAGAWADLPFRNHRYDSFNATPVTSESIVFIGNSITNMHEWGEAFGNNPNVLNRGNSGAISEESLANIESILPGKPKAILIMMGTNDLGTYSGNQAKEIIERNIRQMIERTQKESPATKIYIQSIFPSNVGLRTTERGIEANNMLKGLCQEYGLTYIDLWDDLYQIINSTAAAVPLSNDGLHINSRGYKIWVEKVAPILNADLGLNLTTAYPASLTCDYASTTQSYGMRYSQFGDLPVTSDDVLIIGDEMIHGGEWRELLHSTEVKNRGSVWGYGGRDLAEWLRAIPVILNNNTNKQAPRQIYLYLGLNDVNGSTALTTTKANIQSIITKIRQYAPASSTKIYLMSQLPRTNGTTAARVSTFNTYMQELAAANENVGYVDIFTPLASGTSANPAYITGDYVYAAGYNKIAQVLAPLIGNGAYALTDAEFQAHYSMIMARKELSAAIVTASAITPGTNPGQFPDDKIDALRAKIAEAEALLAADGVTNEQYIAMAQSITTFIAENLISAVKVSSGEDVTWYSFCSTLRGAMDMTHDLSAGLIGVADGRHSSEYSHWKFTARADGSMNIVNRGSGMYINPAATYNTQLSMSATEPGAGWRLESADTSGLFLFCSGTNCEMNQTQSGLGYKIYNWYGTFPDGADQGCQFTIEEVDFNIDEIPDNHPTGWYHIEHVGGQTTLNSTGQHYMINAQDEYRQSTTNFYALCWSTGDTDKPARHFIYLTGAKSVTRVTALNGHGVHENCTSDRNELADNYPNITELDAADNRWCINHWNIYTNDGPESPYVGRSNGSAHQYRITPVAQDVLDAYDIYKVKMIGSVSASEIGSDPRVALNHEANKGITKVYNNGHFFVTKGTELCYDDFAADASAGQSEPEITIDAEGKTITVDYTQKHVAIAELIAEGETAASVYDLQGRRVIRPVPGQLYITNGTKTVK